MEHTPLPPELEPLPQPSAEPETTAIPDPESAATFGAPGLPGTAGSGVSRLPGTPNPAQPTLPGLAKIVARENTERLAFVATVIIVLVALGVAPLVAVSVAAGGLTAAETHRRRGGK